MPSAESSGAGGFGEHSRRVRELDAAWRPLLTFALAILVGVLAGALGAAFRLAVVGVQTHLSGFYAGAGGAIGASWLLPILGTAALVWLAIFIVRRFAPEAGGSGVQEIEGALEGLRPLRWRRLLPVKFAGGLCSLGAGMVLGREGPTIQMGGSLGKMIADRWSLPDAVMRTLVAAGAGAGLTAAFNAPLAGVLFVIEEMRPQFEYSFTSLQSVVLACAAADIVVRALTGQGPVLPVTDFAAPVLASLWLFPILGSIFGILGVAFNRLLVATLDAFASLRGTTLHGAVLGLGMLLGFLAWAYPSAVGGGDDLIPRLFHLPLTPTALIVLFAVRFATTMISYGSGAPGGIFAPMLALGTLLGLWYGHYAHAWLPELVAQPGIFAVAGMGALFTATVRAPITGIALAIELTADYRQILPLLLTCTSATIVAELLGGKPIYTVLLRRTLARERAGA